MTYVIYTIYIYIYKILDLTKFSSYSNFTNLDPPEGNKMNRIIFIIFTDFISYYHPFFSSSYCGSRELSIVRTNKMKSEVNKLPMRHELASDASRFPVFNKEQNRTNSFCAKMTVCFITFVNIIKDSEKVEES